MNPLNQALSLRHILLNGDNIFVQPKDVKEHQVTFVHRSCIR